MKNRVFYRCTLGVLIFCIIFKLTQMIVYYKLNWTIIWEIADWLIWFGIVISASIIIIDVVKKINHKILCTLLLVITKTTTVFILLFLLYISCRQYLLSSPNNYYYFSSPKNRYQIVLIESDNFTGCNVNGYPIRADIFKENCYNGVGFGEPDLPIKKGNYKIKWISDSLAKVTVYSDDTSASFRVNCSSKH